MLCIEDTIFLLNTRRETADKKVMQIFKNPEIKYLHNPELFVVVIISYNCLERKR
jgi:hypothetical protein